MADLTVIILTRNEEDNLPAAIGSVKEVAKRIIIIDSFSTDNTVDVATALGCDVYQHEWSNHAAQFNWGLDNCNVETEWVLRLDADEELTSELAVELHQRLPALPNDISGIQVNLRTMFLGRFIKHGGMYPYWHLRIFRHSAGRCEEKVMDEHIVISSGRTIKAEHDFLHHVSKSLTSWTNKHNWYSDRECYEVLNLERLKADGKLLKPSMFGSFAEKKRWLKENIYLRLPLGYRAWLYFAYRYYIKLGFLDGPEGRIFHFLQAYWYRFLVDAKIYEAKKNGGYTGDSINRALD